MEKDAASRKKKNPWKTKPDDLKPNSIKWKKKQQVEKQQKSIKA